jgi:hypothetical protein
MLSGIDSFLSVHAMRQTDRERERERECSCHFSFFLFVLFCVCCVMGFFCLSIRALK